MGQLQKILKALAKPQFAGATISQAKPAWEVSDTGQVITIGDDASIVDGQYGKQIALRDDDVTFYFAIGNDKDGNSLFDADADTYRIMFMKYVGKDANKKSCFKAEPIV